MGTLLCAEGPYVDVYSFNHLRFIILTFQTAINLTVVDADSATATET